MGQCTLKQTDELSEELFDQTEKSDIEFVWFSKIHDVYSPSGVESSSKDVQT